VAKALINRAIELADDVTDEIFRLAIRSQLEQCLI